MLRRVAAGCSGAACDWFIPLSLLLPLLVLILVAITGTMATRDSWRRQPRSFWPPLLGALTLLGIVGPIIALGIFRDSPDRFVAIATLLLALVPAAAVAYGLFSREAAGGLAGRSRSRTR